MQVPITSPVISGSKFEQNVVCSIHNLNILLRCFNKKGQEEGKKQKNYKTVLHKFLDMMSTQ